MLCLPDGSQNILLAQLDTKCPVHLQQFDGSPTDWRSTHDDAILHREVVVPTVLSRIEKSDLFATLQIDGGEIGPFVSVAARARPSQIAWIVVWLMNLGDNMFDVKRKAICFFGDATVFAAPACPLPDKLTSRIVHDSVVGRK